MQLSKGATGRCSVKKVWWSWRLIEWEIEVFLYYLKFLVKLLQLAKWRVLPVQPMAIKYLCSRTDTSQLPISSYLAHLMCSKSSCPGIFCKGLCERITVTPVIAKQPILKSLSQKNCWYHLLYADVICFLNKEMSKNEQWWK